MDSAPQTPPLRHDRDHNSKKDLSGHEHKEIVSALLCESKYGALLGPLRHSAFKELAEMFHVHPKTIKQISSSGLSIMNSFFVTLMIYSQYQRIQLLPCRDYKPPSN